MKKSEKISKARIARYAVVINNKLKYKLFINAYIMTSHKNLNYIFSFLHFWTGTFKARFIYSKSQFLIDFELTRRRGIFGNPLIWLILNW